MTETVKFTRRLWSTEVALAEARDALDAPIAGQMPTSRTQPYPRAYEFSNGRTFKDGKKPE